MNFITGTSGNDTLTDTALDDTIFGLEGDDIITLSFGADYVDGGPGNDLFKFNAVAQYSGLPPEGVLDGGTGFDTLDVSNISPTTFGVIQNQAGEFVTGLFVGSQRFELANFERVILGSGNQYINVDGKRDAGLEIYAGGGDDQISASGAVSVFGEDGNDILYLSGTFGSSVQGRASGGTGFDTLVANISFNVDLSMGIATSGGATWHIDTIENIRLTTFGYASTAIGDDLANIISVSDQLDNGTVGVIVDGRGGHDSITGSAGNDILSGGDGNDGIGGGGGDDKLYGGVGDDALYGGPGADLLDGGAGFDSAAYSIAAQGVVADLQFASTQNTGEALGDSYIAVEQLLGSDFSDSLRGDALNNNLRGGYGDDTLFGRDGDDALSGEWGNDTLLGDAGADTLNGGEGNDHLLGGTGGDSLDGGSGFDYAAYTYSTGPVVSDLQFAASQNRGEAQGDSYTNIEGLIGSAFSDHLSGDQNDNWLWGNGGGDYLFGRDGNDVLVGADDSDTLVGEDGNDTLYGNDGSDYLHGGAGADRLFGGAGFDYALYSFGASSVTADLQFGSENTGDATGDDYASVEGLVGSAFSDSLRGDMGNNYLWGEDGHDALYGRDGNDVLIGNAGNDYLIGGNGNDMFVFGAGDGRDTIYDMQAGNGAGDVIQLSTALGINSYASLQAHASQVGADTVINFDNHTSLTLINTVQWSLAIDDFIFV